MSIIRDIVYGAVRRGANLEELCHRSGIRKEDLENTDLRINFEQGHLVWKEALALTNDPFLGLHSGESTTPSVIGLVGHLMQSSPDLKSAFINLSTFTKAVTEMIEYSFHESKDQCILEFEPMHIWKINYPETAKQAVEQSMSGSIHVMKLLTGRSIFPTRIEIAIDKPLDYSEYNKVLKATPQFNSPKNRLYFNSSEFALPVIGYNKELFQLFKSHLQKILDQKQAGKNYTKEVRRILLEKFQYQFPSLSDVAETLSTTERALQRKLKDESTSFQKIADEVRKELAESMLKAGKLTVYEIAYLLGYSDAPAFRRAFKRMTGQNPTNFKS